MDIKIYALRGYGWDNTDCTLFYNPIKDYSDNEFKQLCAELTCKMIDAKVKENIEFSKRQTYPNIALSLVKYHKDIYWYEIQGNVEKELLNFGFKVINSNIDFALDLDQEILQIKEDEEPSEEQEMVQKCYKQYTRKKKIKKLI